MLINISTFSIRVFQSVISSFQPDAIVCQCGADAMTGDPLGNI